MKTALDSTIVKQLGWWIVNFDEENKKWFEEAFPKEPTHLRGQINAPGGKDIRLSIGGEPVKIAPNIDKNVYNFYIEVIPAADDLFALHFAKSANTKFARNWGLKVGTNAGQAME